MSTMKLYRRKDRPNWYIRHKGKLISLSTARKAYAQQLLEEYQAKSLGIYRVPNRRISVFVKPYLDYCARHNKATTIDDKKRTLNSFKISAGDPWLRQLDKKKVEVFLDGRLGKRTATVISPDRYNAERQVLSNFFNYLIGERILKNNPCREVLKKKIVKGKAKECLTQVQEAQLDKFLTTAALGRWTLASVSGSHDPVTAGEQTNPMSSKRFSADACQELARAKAVAINTGLRARELVNLWWSDIDWQNKTARVSEKPDWKPKDYEERVVPLNKAALTALRAQKTERGVLGRYVFSRQDGRKYGRGLDVAMCRAFRLAGFAHGGLHTLRHTFATRYLAKGGTLEDLRDLLGHSDIRTTQRYLHSDSEAQRKTVERL